MKNNKTENKVIPARIRQARISRGLSLSDLADLVGVTKQAISQYELGSSEPSEAIMFKIMDILNYPIVFFQKPIDSRYNNYSSTVTYFRSKKTTRIKSKEAAEEKLKIFSEIDDFLRQFINFPDVDFPSIEYEKYNDELSLSDIEEIALKLRKHWDLGLYPIEDLTSLVQEKGVVVSKAYLGNKKIDAFSKWFNNIPYIFLGSDKESAVRSRFDIAHELGHLLMHMHVSEKDFNNKEKYDRLEEEANKFAAAFLLPAESFSREVYSSSINHLIMLKKKWKVAMSCMINRCSDLNLLSENQITYLKNQMTKYQYWRKEPLDDTLKAEKPFAHKQAINLLLDNLILTVNDIVQKIACYPEEIEQYCFLDNGTLKMKTPDNIISLKKINKMG
ncbi:XRE family transcriptional regulator [Petroclostridium sp. X23]|uniref:helix-turn-helix domain-containing protein n=1 Tax=Petroclostridium sp. X23 TaxID=3045146 RepID=UPI0024AE5FBD|nr:XRE family transcriptional regulator [Petroclostridium sp. X23]WHH59191.1 XRE family transcriptional regulator [Petroclostridium sp. X23]